MADPSHTGNKGEWGELYTLFKILGDGFIVIGDKDHQPTTALPNFGVTGASRSDGIRFEIDGEKGEVALYRGDEPKDIVPQSVFGAYASEILNALTRDRKGESAFAIPSIDDFMEHRGIKALKARSNEKADISLEVLDPRAEKSIHSRYSIKSYFGGPPTLLNTSDHTKFIYSITGPMTDELSREINGISPTKNKVQLRVQAIRDAGCDLEFKSLPSPVFSFNLLLIERHMPEICAAMLLDYFSKRGKGVSELTDLRVQSDRIFDDAKQADIFYPYKMKDLLQASALGMTPGHRWMGTFEANAGYLVTLKSGTVLAYSFNDITSFRDYLYGTTRFDSPSTSRYEYGTVYRNGDCFEFALSMQIRSA